MKLNCIEVLFVLGVIVLDLVCILGSIFGIYMCYTLAPTTPDVLLTGTCVVGAILFTSLIKEWKEWVE